MVNRSWFVILPCLLFVASASAHEATIEPADRLIVLTGTMRMLHSYGPPGYGEDHRTDVKVSYLALQLPFKITTACTPQLPELQDIQCDVTDVVRLIFSENMGIVDLKGEARSLVGRKVIVTGVLHRKESMSDYTPVYMDVADASAKR